MNRRLFSLTRGIRLPLAMTILSGVVAGWLTIAQARGLSLVVDDVFLGGAGWLAVRDMLLGLAGVIALRALLAWLGEVSANALALRVKQDLRTRLFAHIHALGPAFTRRERSGELTTAAVEGVEALDAYFSQYLPQLALSALVPLSVLLFVFPIDPLSGVVLLVTAPLIPVFMILIGKGAEAVTRRQYEMLGRLSAHFTDSLQGLVTLKLFGRSREQARSIAAASGQFRDITLGVLRVTFLSALALELIATISTAVVAVEVGLRLLYGSLPFDKALFLLMLAPEFYLPLRLLGLRFHAGMAGTSAAKRIYAILDLPLADLPLADGAGQVVQARRGELLPPGTSLSLHDLAFTYPGEAQPVLSGINLELPAGEHLALVGPSGGGKSTLAALLLRFHLPSAGGIRVAGKPLEQIPLADWRAQTAWVPQDPHLFHDTIAANLRIVRPEADEPEMFAALQAAHLDAFVHSLPQGLQTVIGEQGERLSGGQAQRLALARAFLKDAPVLILDEPTSSLDPQTEALLEASTRRLMQGRTVITLAHRLNTIRAARQIVVLQAGVVVESGDHAALMARRGMYAGMLRAMEGIDTDDQAPAELPSSARQAGSVLPSQTATAQVPAPARRSPVLARLLSNLQGSWGRVALSVCLGALTIAASIGLMGASSWLISMAALHPSIADLNLAIVGVRFFGLLRGVARYTERLTSHDVTFRLLARLRTWFYERLEPLAPAHLAGFRLAELVDRILADVEALEHFYVRALSPPLVALVILPASALFLGAYAPGLGWVHLGFGLLLGFFLPLLTLALGKSPGEDYSRQRAALRIGVLDLVQGLADLLANGRGTDFLERLKRQGELLGQAQGRMARLTGISSAAGVLIANLGMWTVLALSIPLVRAGRLDGVMLAVLALMAYASFEALLPLPHAAQTLSASLASARRLYEIVAPRTTEGCPVQPPAGMLAALPPRPALQVRALTFAYPGSAAPALRDLTFDLPPGGKLGIVGPSGAGKSTLFHLLLGFRPAPQGSILLDGHAQQEMTGETLRQAFSVISQHTHLFNASLRENLLLGIPDVDPAQIEQIEQIEQMEQMEQAARLAGIHDFIRGLPQGYETQAGERGLRFSAGERQRLAIARALLRPAPILLLDEPVASLDALAARSILENLFNLPGDRSLLIITHRLAGLEALDEILVLEDGLLVERGSHAALMRTAGLYRRMVDLQRRILDDTGSGA